MTLVARLVLALVVTASVVSAQSVEVPVIPEVFQVFELPITITNPALVKTKNGYVLKCSLANGSESRELGFRYSLAVVDAANEARIIVNRSEGFALAPYQTKNVTFRTPLRLNLKGDERLVLMVEQLVSTDYVWEVLQAKEALASYAAGDYSTTPRVLRVLNQVDAPVQLRIPFK
ncbi:MAG TPA: hypothetical protein VGJ37_02470 [Pyrinomonadaceae bacterium]|jgi:hypothetical protein